MVAISEQNEYYNEKVEESETDDTCDDSDDDSEEDPCFNILEDTRSTFSKLSIKKKSKSGIQKEKVEEMEGDPELIVPDLDEKDQKSFETVQKIIEVGQIDKLKVDQCKVYLRKHGLRLTGNKDTLIGRIREHFDIANGGGEKKYPASSFIVNCKGDACMGDVVMFEQNVYEMFSIASRSATGPPCGTRVVAGRIIKESYGAAKQQHTFTIEVLWSKGEKPLPSLHPLLIKGRNLYKLRTMRQRWQDEGERQKILLEKHTRGSVARSDRESRIQEKEMRKALKANRVSRTETHNLKMEAQKILPSILGRHPSEKQNTQTTLPINLGKLVNQQENVHQNECRYSKTWNANTSDLSEAHCRKVTTFFSNSNMPSERVHCERQPFAVINHRKPCGYEQGIISSDPFRGLQAREDNTGFNHMKSPLRSHGHSQGRTRSNLRSRSPFRRQNNNEQKQLCKYYPQGRCYYGDQCKFVHEYNREENRSYGQRRNERWPSDLGYY